MYSKPSTTFLKAGFVSRTPGQFLSPCSYFNDAVAFTRTPLEFLRITLFLRYQTLQKQKGYGLARLVKMDSNGYGSDSLAWKPFTAAA